MSDTNTSTGKIGRLPANIREEVNQRIHDGEPARKIIAWLHSLPEVLAVLEEYFGEEPVNAQNITNWRQTGYRQWVDRQDRVHRVRELSQYALRLAEQGGGDLMTSSAAIAGGQLLDIIESLDVEAQRRLLTEKPESYIDLLQTLARLQKSGADARRADQAERAVELAEEKLKLELAKFQRTTAELFLKWYADKKAADIADSSDRPEVKMDKLVQLMFGEKPEDMSDGK